MSKMQFKKVIQAAEWEETLCTMQVRIHSPQIAIDVFTNEWKEILHLVLMEQSSNSISEQTGFEQRWPARIHTSF
jgi:hypothetical protein